MQELSHKSWHTFIIADIGVWGVSQEHHKFKTAQAIEEWVEFNHCQATQWDVKTKC